MLNTHNPCIIASAHIGTFVNVHLWIQARALNVNSSMFFGFKIPKFTGVQR